MTLAKLLSEATNRLSSVSDSPRLDAEVLLCHVLEKPRSYLFSWPEHTLDGTQHSAFQQYLEQRLGGTPIAHIIGQREFWSLQLTVTADTLIPRPDTELLVEWVLDHYPAQPTIRLADLGTGSGAIALAIASERPQWTILATDQSASALAVAQANRDALHLNNVTLGHGHWCEALQNEIAFDVIVSNPPYIPGADPHLQQGDVRFEPRSALVSGTDGLNDIRHIVDCSASHLVNGGALIVEHGYDQANAVAAIFEQAGYQQVLSHRDLAGRARAISAIRS